MCVPGTREPVPGEVFGRDGTCAPVPVRIELLMRLLFLLGFSAALFAQTPDGVEDCGGPGRQVPQLKKRVDPEFPPDAEMKMVEERVEFLVVVEKNGRGVPQRPVRPLSPSMDRAAREALAKWRFSPGTRKGSAVSCLATVEVTFRLTAKAEAVVAETRSAYNRAAADAERGQEPGLSKGLAEMRRLAEGKYAPAMLTQGVWLVTGRNVARDAAQGMALLLAAGEQGYAPALAQAGIYSFEGKLVPQDKQKGLALLKDSAEKGSAEGQLYLGEWYSNEDAKVAAGYYRQCAVGGQAACQFRLAEMLLAGGAEQRVEAVAWLDLAAAKGYAAATALLNSHRPAFTMDERSSGASMRGKLMGDERR